MIEFDAKFIAMVDELIMLADKDKELLESIRWIDNQSKESGISFYEAFYNLIEVLYSIHQETEGWLDNKSRISQYSSLI